MKEKGKRQKKKGWNNKILGNKRIEHGFAWVVIPLLNHYNTPQLIDNRYSY